MKIDYRVQPDKFGPYIYTAILGVSIALPRANAPRTKRFEAIIDSGATRCMSHADIGRFIGLERKPMTTSDKVVLTVGIMTVATMIVTGWTGERMYQAFMSKREPKPDPAQNAANRSIRKRKRWAAPWIIGVEGLFLLVLTWWKLGHSPVTFVVVFNVAAGFSAVTFGILASFINDILHINDHHMDVAIHQWEVQKEHWEITKEIAKEVDKKAYSRKKAAPQIEGGDTNA